MPHARAQRVLPFMTRRPVPHQFLQGAKSPLLWEEGQVEELLAGSPVVGEIQERLRVSLTCVTLTALQAACWHECAWLLLPCAGKECARCRRRCRRCRCCRHPAWVLLCHPALLIALPTPHRLH